jgi:hypothetical protein
MKRRDLLGYAVTSTGLLAPAWARAATPCPPPTVSVGGGTSVNSGCSAVTAESDWVARKSATGVKWAHDFRSASEFTKYAYFTGAQPTSWLQHMPTNGIGNGGCIQFSVPAGSHCNHSWPRPFSAFPGDVGYVSGPDYGSTSDWYKWRQGFYGHSDYHASSPGAFVGTDYYIQFRVKFSPSYFNSGNPGGKLAYIDIAGGGNQEVIVTAPSQLFYMYTNFGRQTSNPLGQPQGDRTAYNPSYPFTIMQPGGSFNSSCTYDTYNPSTCWAYPTDEWATVLLHVIPGHHNGDAIGPRPSDVYGSTGRKDTGIEAWVARQGQKTYTKIWDKKDYAWNYDATSPAYGNQLGFNIFIFSAYKNNVPAAVDWWVRLGQVIFSTQPIACPQV